MSLRQVALCIYTIVAPGHSVNQARTLVIAQVGAATLGMLAFLAIGPGYISGRVAMVAAIIGMILFNVMHPPAVSTALSFGLRAGDERNLALFCLAVGMTAVLVILQRAATWLLRRAQRRPPS